MLGICFLLFSVALSVDPYPLSASFVDAGGKTFNFQLPKQWLHANPRDNGRSDIFQLGAYDITVCQVAGSSNVGCLITLGGGLTTIFFQSYTLNSMTNITGGIIVSSVSQPSNTCPSGTKLSQNIFCNASGTLPIPTGTVKQVSDCEFSVSVGLNSHNNLFLTTIKAEFHSIAGCPVAPNCSSASTCSSCGESIKQCVLGFPTFSSTKKTRGRRMRVVFKQLYLLKRCSRLMCRVHQEPQVSQRFCV